MIRFGLCSNFHEQPITYRAMSGAQLKSLKDPKEFLYEIISDNLFSLKIALKFCVNTGIGSYRIPSGLFPMYTHPDYGYQLEELPHLDELLAQIEKLKNYAATNNLRLTMHLDDFVVLNTPRHEVLKNSLREIEYHVKVIELFGGDVVTIQGGGAYGDKRHALQLLKKNMPQVPKHVFKYLTLKNDDKNYTPQDMLPFCEEYRIPLVLDAHHYRCNPDEMTIDEATKLALKTWDREPLFHISSPQEGWRSMQPWKHHEWVNSDDFPKCWLKIDPLTVDVEARAQELAVLDLMRRLPQNT